MKRDPQDIDQFFEQFRQLPEYYSLDKAQQRISKPDVGVTKSGKVNFNPLKLIIMTSAFTIGLLSLIFWFSPSVKNKAERHTRAMNSVVRVPKKMDEKNEEKPDSPNDRKDLEDIGKNLSPDIIDEPIQEPTSLSKIQPLRPVLNGTISYEDRTNYFDKKLKPLPNMRHTPLTIEENLTPVEDLLKGVNLIELSPKELIALGFTIRKVEIRYLIESNDDFFDVMLFEGGQGVEIFEDTLIGKSTHEVVFLSNLYGKQNVMWKAPDDHRDKWEASYFQERIQFLIPVVLRKSDYPDILYQDQIFWFEPNEAFFDALPEAIGKPLEQEYNYLATRNNEPRTKANTSCTYFETCKSTLQLNDLKLYPNPARQVTTIEFEAPEEITGTILLTDINGNVKKTLAPKRTFPQGFIKCRLDLSGVSPGIYLVSIITNKGFKTRRLILSR